MKNKSKKYAKVLDYVIGSMKESVGDGENVPPLKMLVQAACDEYGIKYTDNARRSVSKSLQRAGIDIHEYNVNISKAVKKNAVRKKAVKPEPVNFMAASKKEVNSERDTFIISWAQNATPVHEGLFANMKAYTEHLDAEMLVIAGRYNNPTSVFADRDRDYWPKPVLPYLDANRHNIHEHLQVLSDIKVTPTAATPLSGFNSITGLESCIIGHPRQHLKSLPVLNGYPTKLLLSTGACTVENYTDSKAGKKGNFHHVLGFVIVELDGEHFHIRQVSADADGNFYDAFHKVTGGKVRDNVDGCDIAVMGDIHLRHNDRTATKAAFGLLDMMKPKHTMIHDIFDGESISHHEMNDPFRMMYKENSNKDSLLSEISDMIDWIRDRVKYNLVVVRSNHDDFLDRWLKFADWRKVANKSSYLELALTLSKETEAQKKGIIPYLISRAFGDRVRTLSESESFRAHSIELGVHGHIGANGSRGSVNQFKNLNTKLITGHTHSASLTDGHTCVGTLTHLRVGYNTGPSSWTQSICLVYPDGKSQLLHYVNGAFTRRK